MLKKKKKSNQTWSSPQLKELIALWKGVISELLGDNDDSVEPVLCTNSPGELCDLRRDNDLDTDFKGKTKG